MSDPPLESLKSLSLDHVPRIAGTAVFVSPEGELDASAVVRYLALHHHLPRQVVLVKFQVELVPHVPPARQAVLSPWDHGIVVADLRFGFCDEPDVPSALDTCEGLRAEASYARYYLCEEAPAPAARFKLPAWQRRLFAWMSKACVPAAEYLHLPQTRTTSLAAG